MPNSSSHQLLPSVKCCAWILISIAIIFIIGLSLNIIITSKQLCILNDFVTKSKEFKNPILALQHDSLTYYEIKNEDLQKISDYIDFLSEKIETEIKTVQDSKQADIDRISIMLTIGIALLAVIGGLFPVFVNHLSKEILEKKLNELQDSVTTLSTKINDTKKTADTASSTATNAKTIADTANTTAINAKRIADDTENSVQNATNKLTTLEEEQISVKDSITKASKKLPIIDLLVFQNAVSKLNSSDAWNLNTLEHRKGRMILILDNLISHIKTNLILCESYFFAKCYAFIFTTIG